MIFDLINQGADPGKVIGIFLCGMWIGHFLTEVLHNNF